MFLKRVWRPIGDHPRRWLLLILLALLTHPLLDAHTAYGTQLWWPLNVAPTAWATLFIIDPLFTAPLFFSVLLAIFLPRTRVTNFILIAGLTLSSVYLSWSWVGRTIVQHDLKAWLDTTDRSEADYFLTPTPFNTLLWRVVVMSDNGYLEGVRSIVVDSGAFDLKPIQSDETAIEQSGHIWAVKQLEWFSLGFIRAQTIDEYLVLSDLRMGQYPHYVFTHKVAQRNNNHWQEIEAERLPNGLSLAQWPEVWNRIWTAGNSHNK